MDALWLQIVQWLHGVGLHVDAGAAQAVAEGAARATQQLDMPAGVGVSGLESDGAGLFYCGGGGSGKVRAVRRPGAQSQSA